jgi:hypothetical protein
MPEESLNSAVEQRLAEGEGMAAAHLGVGEMQWKGEASAAEYFYSGRRERWGECGPARQ